MTDKSSKRIGTVHRFVRWLFGAAFEELPPEFGDPVPPELRVFEAEAEEIQHHPVGNAASGSSRGNVTRPGQRSARTRAKWLERS